MKFPVKRDPGPAHLEPVENTGIPVQDEPLRVIVQEIPVPGHEPGLQPTSFEDTRTIAAARKARPGGYLRLPLEAVKSLGNTSVVLLSKFMRGTDLILRVRLFPTPAPARR